MLSQITPWMYPRGMVKKKYSSFLMTDVVCSFKQQQLETNQKLRTLGIASKINHGLWVIASKISEQSLNSKQLSGVGGILDPPLNRRITLKGVMFPFLVLN